jgi:hypothetical protein
MIINIRKMQVGTLGAKFLTLPTLKMGYYIWAALFFMS